MILGRQLKDAQKLINGRGKRRVNHLRQREENTQMEEEKYDQIPITEQMVGGGRA